jgi:hypothetical protein
MAEPGNTQHSRTNLGRTAHGSLRFLGKALLALSVLLFLSAAFVAETALDSGTAWEIFGAGVTLAFLAALAGAKCLKKGKQLDALSAQDLLIRDNRPPVVYLRSFQDDAVAAEGSLNVMPLGGGFIMGGMVAILDSLGGIMSEEEQLAEALKDVGPFIAIGRPGEKLPQLGASRMYLPDSEWRGKVSDLMSRASLVVLRAGKSDGLLWEVQTAAKSVRPEKLLILLPYEREQYDLFRAQAEKFLSHRLPDYPVGKRKVTAGSVRGILYFGPDWTPHFLEPKALARSAKPWVAVFKTTLQPVFKQLHVDVKLPRPNYWKVLLWVVLSPVLVLLAVFAVLAVLHFILKLLGD